MASSRYIVLFTRSPEAEARAKGLPRAQGARLFWALLDSWREAARTAAAELLIVSPGPHVAALADRFAGPGIAVEEQSGRRFGERLADAAGRAFARGAGAVLLAGCDSPPPPAHVLRGAFTRLEAGRPVVLLAPARDGGVNLIGLVRCLPDALRAIVPGSPAVGRTFARMAGEAGFEVVRLPTASDLDGLRDVSRAYHLAHGETAWRPYRFLIRQILVRAISAVATVADLANRTSVPLLPSRAPPAA